MGESIEVQVAKMTVSLKEIEKSFDEMKQDTKEFHTQQTKKLDDLTQKWSTMSGEFKGMVDIQRQVNKHAAFITNHEPMLKEIKEERRQDRKQVRDLIWKIVAVGAVSTLLGTNAMKIIESLW